MFRPMAHAKSSATRKSAKSAATKTAAPAAAEAGSYAVKRRELTDRLNKLRVETKELAANASQLLTRITERHRV